MPLFVMDFNNDEKLRMCSAAATGVYIRLMCILHKSKDYGKLHLCKEFVYTNTDTNAIQTQIQNESDKENLYSAFAENLAKQMPYKPEIIKIGLLELDYYGVIQLEGNTLYQPRMVRDAKLSETRRKSINSRWGAKEQPETFVPTKPKTKRNTKSDTNTHTNNNTNAEIENEYENNIIDSEEKKGDAGEREEAGATATAAPAASTTRPGFTPPTIEEVAAYCRERANGINPQQFVDFYSTNGWKQKGGNPIKDWKACVRTWETNGINRHSDYGTGTAANTTGRPNEVQGSTTETRTRRSTI